MVGELLGNATACPVNSRVAPPRPPGAMFSSCRRRIWIANRFFDGLADPMVRNLTIEDAGDVFTYRSIPAMSLDQDPLKKIVRQVDRPSHDPLGGSLLASPQQLASAMSRQLDQSAQHAQSS